MIGSWQRFIGSANRTRGGKSLNELSAQGNTRETLSGQDRSRLESIIERFESAWEEANGRRCQILGTKPCDLKVLVGTPGVGKGTFASVGFNGLISEESKPAADIEFPAAAGGAAAVTARYELAHRC
jgi:hypothetical protein